MKLAADANVLLSAVIGGRARLVFRHSGIQEILTTAHTFSEVEEYAPILAARRGLPADVVILAVAALPITIIERARYAKKLPEALRRIGNRDPEDAELLALALQFRIPVWSNDKDFRIAHVDLFNTADLLRHLEVIDQA
ncbi:MAG: PIN domain-containing protein [Candidatus Sulfotelmatobacter sp.]